MHSTYVTLVIFISRRKRKRWFGPGSTSIASYEKQVCINIYIFIMLWNQILCVTKGHIHQIHFTYLYRVFSEMFFPGTPQTPRRRTSVLSRVSPHYLQQHFKSNKRFTDLWKRNDQNTLDREEENGTNNNPGPSPASSIGDVREGNVPPSEVSFHNFLIYIFIFFVFFFTFFVFFYAGFLVIKFIYFVIFCFESMLVIEWQIYSLGY